MRLRLALSTVLTAALLIACHHDATVTSPMADTLRAITTPPSHLIYADDGTTFTELPEEQQDWIESALTLEELQASSPCPPTYPPLGKTALPLWAWYTVSYMNGYPIQRKIYFNLPYTFTQAGPAGICGYSYTRGVSDDGEWEVTGGTLWLKFVNLLGVYTAAKIIRVEGAHARRISGGGDGGGGCEDTRLTDEPTDTFYDPYEDTCGGSGGGGGGDGGSGGSGGTTCRSEYIIIEIDYGDGTGWHTWWEGYATVCE